MTWVDILLLIILFGLILQGIIVGLIRGVFDIIGIISGYLLAINYNEAIRIPRFFAFLLIFFVVAVSVSITGRIISRSIRATPYGLIDKILGGVLGFLKGFIICFVFLIILLLLQRANRVIHESKIVPWVLKGGLTMTQVLPRQWYKKIEEIVIRRELVKFQMPNFKYQINAKL